MLNVDPNEVNFASAVIDALDSHICVIDRDGVIISVNRAWRDYGNDNRATPGRSGVGMHYLNVCQNAAGPGADEAADFAAGVQSVIGGEVDMYQCEYPCHSPTEQRWFLGRVTPLQMEQKGAVISHMNITQRKLMEFEMARLAATDPLTGLPNRRFFLESANREVERVGRFATPASVVMIDIDHFKSVNDTYGHAVGDGALRRLSRACKDALRPVDVLARLGGEEFVALLPGVDEESAAKVAERLRRRVAETPIEVGDKQIHLTASFGIAGVQRDDQRVEYSLARADSALYEAKRSGRNRVAISVPTLVTGGQLKAIPAGSCSAG